jgi:transcriptional regulator with XRE-family HTH domain
MNTVSEQIIKVMKRKNIKQSQLSKSTGISKSIISEYIHGKFIPKKDNLSKIAKALGVTENYLYGETLEDIEPIVPQDLLKEANIGYFKMLANITTDQQFKKRLEELIENMEKIET